MRIQHNIMALNAYRQLGGNNSALAKNLEKLSSGYRINRAGDDAAGLAISEKMRAQIKGLEAAQKNANDGISLVQTAEGALTEVHSMLNRMVYLATQSANGTYDNEVDRANLDKEVQTLKEEIDRISKSTNFNGLNLLDGSMNGAEGKEVTTTTDAVTTTMTPEFLPAKGSVLGTNTVLHKDTANGTTGTTFSVDLHNTVFSNNADDSMTLKVGDLEVTLAGNGNGELAGEDLVNALVEEINKGADPADGTIDWNGSGIKFKVTAGTDGDNRITFQQVNAPSGPDDEFDGDMKVEITGDVGSGTASAGVPAKKATYTIDLSNATGGDVDAGATFSDAANAAAKQSKIDGVNVTFDGNIDKTMQKFVEDYNSYEDAATGATKDFEASWDGKVLTLTAKYAGALDPGGAGNGTTVPQAAPAMTDVGDLTQNKEAVKEVQVLDLTGATQASVAAKQIDGVAIDWDTDLDTTMKAFVEKYNKETSKTYEASWADNKLTMTAKVAGTAGGTTTGVPAAGLIATDVAHTTATKATYTITVTAADADVGAGDKITINGTDYTVGTDITAADAQDANKLAEFIKSKLASNDYDITVENNVITYTAKTEGAAATQPPFAFAATQGTGTAASITDNWTAGADVTNGAAAFTQVTAGDDAGVTTAATAAFTEAQAGADADGDGVVVIGTPDYNFKTTAIKNVTANSGDRLASTYFDLTEDMVVDGGKFTIGKQDYTFSSDVADEGQAGKVYIGDLLDAEGNVDIANNLDKIAQRITDAAKDNTTWTVGHDKGGATLSFVEKQDQTEYVDDKGNSTLTSVENIAETFGWTGVSSTTTTIEGAGDGKTLTLQVGDTADEFQKVTLNIKDMSTEGLDIADVNISTIEDATAAIDKIKAAINTVSAQRGDLGAVQNRLEHTINNLGVQTENITAAESRIRDTDMAEEMMAYTKNNILVQAAQAMLAQANQVPQGILQLLQ